MLDKIKNPILFQGNLKKKHYFEGWYYKQVSKDERTVISFIPGISLSKDDDHSFVQYIFSRVVDKNNIKIISTGYLKYPIEAFKFSNNPFRVQIRENIFSESEVSIKLIDDKVNIQGVIGLGRFTPIKRSILMPNIMGFFAYIPKMQCYHGVISMNHNLNGTLKINGEEIDFNNGKGYIEKDWGTSFPKEYIWIQCNNFKKKITSVFFSIADIPFMNKSFRGYICNISVNRKQYRFATYNNSKMKIENITNKNIRLVLENRHAKLNIEAILNQCGELIAPQNGNMKKKIKQDLVGTVKIYLYDKKSKRAYEDVGSMAGIEIVNFYTK